MKPLRKMIGDSISRKTASKARDALQEQTASVFSADEAEAATPPPAPPPNLSPRGSVVSQDSSRGSAEFALGSPAPAFAGGSAANVIGDTGSLLVDIVEVLRERSEELIRSARAFTAFVEHRIAAEIEQAKAQQKAARAAMEPFSTMRGDGTYKLTVLEVLRYHDREAQRTLDVAAMLAENVLTPLQNKRQLHEKSRKGLFAKYESWSRKLQEDEQQLERLRLKYHSLHEAWVRALQDKAREEGSVYKVKLEKRSKEEEEARVKSHAAEEAYRQQIRATNESMENLKRYTQLIASALERLISETESTYQECLRSYAAVLSQHYVPMFGVLADLEEAVSRVNNDEDLRRFVAKQSKGEVWRRRAHAFEKTYSASELKDMATPPASSQRKQQDAHIFRSVAKALLCDQCGRISVKAVLCTACGLVCHKRCVEKVPIECGKFSRPDAPGAKQRSLRMFGVALADQPCAAGTDIPLLVATCTAEVEKRGMTQEGIYRIGGVKSAIEKLSELFEASWSAPDLSCEQDINAVTGCLRLFLRQLPAAVLSGPAYDRCMTLADADQLSVPAVREAWRLLPPAHYALLACLLRHLAHVASHAAENKMAAANLAVVFGPTLTPQSAGLEMARAHTLFVKFAVSHTAALLATDDADGDANGLKSNIETTSSAVLGGMGADADKGRVSTPGSDGDGDSDDSTPLDPTCTVDDWISDDEMDDDMRRESKQRTRSRESSLSHLAANEPPPRASAADHTLFNEDTDHGPPSARDTQEPDD